MATDARAKAATHWTTGAVRTAFLAAFHELFDGETILDVSRRLGMPSRVARRGDENGQTYSVFDGAYAGPRGLDQYRRGAWSRGRRAT